MIFQDPMTYLNPVFTIGQQLVDVILAHQRVRPPSERLGRREARDHAIEMLRRVHLPNPERQMRAYPHQLSGGMRQRRADRAGALRQSAPADRGRADHRARRDDPGPDPRSHRGAHGRSRSLRHHDLARPRGGRQPVPARHRDVRGTGGGGRIGLAAVLLAGASVIPGGCCGRCRIRGGGRRRSRAFRARFRTSTIRRPAAGSSSAARTPCPPAAAGRRSTLSVRSSVSRAFCTIRGAARLGRGFRRPETVMLELRDLHVHFDVSGRRGERTIVRAVNGVSLAVGRASRSDSSASRAPESRRSARRPCAWWTRPAARCCSTARTSPDFAVPSNVRCAARRR